MPPHAPRKGPRGVRMNALQIKPNVPLTLALKDLEGTYDPDRETVTYSTLAGQQLTLPRPAVIKLNLLEPQPGEEIVITNLWSGKRWDKSEWTVALSPNSEKCRAKAEEKPSELTQQLEASIEHERERRRSLGDPTPIRRPTRKQPKPEVQPRLFDKEAAYRTLNRGTGTHGPAVAYERRAEPTAAEAEIICRSDYVPEDVPRSMPLPAMAIGRATTQGKIPANVAIREILAFLKADPSTANWSDQAIQDLASTVYISSVKQGHVGLWERQG